MSSLRVETLRLCWIEAFVEVVDSENISQAARKLGVDQSTVSRYLQSLEKWLGKKLIDPGKITDPDDPRRSIGITEDGLLFYDAAKTILKELTDCRTEQARGKEILAEMTSMNEKMQADLQGKKPSKSVKHVELHIELQGRWIGGPGNEVPIAELENRRGEMRRFFAAYELSRMEETRRGRRKVKGIDPRLITVPASRTDKED